MSLLIASSGRRVQLVKQFKEELNKHKLKVYTTDRDQYAPALYYSDNHFILDDRSILNQFQYIEKLVAMCKELKVSHLLTLHDEQLLLFAEHAKHFELNSIKLIASDYDLIKTCHDKSEYNKLQINQVPTVIVKNRYGSASGGLVRQPFIEGQEYNVQCYFDLISGNLVDMFMQEKLGMRSGETDKSISIWDDEIYQEINKLSSIRGFKGPIDIDVIKGERTYIIDINLRFGGGYQLAHYCGCDFVSKIVSNMHGEEMPNICGQPYPLGVAMMKYNGLFFKE
jgi:carbamoyl-phosphate synthase large subunit